MEANFVMFYSPGSFVAEETTKPVESWDPDVAAEMARIGSYRATIREVADGMR